MKTFSWGVRNAPGLHPGPATPPAAIIYIIKPLPTLLSTAVNKSQQYQEKNSWECQEIFILDLWAAVLWFSFRKSLIHVQMRWKKFSTSFLIFDAMHTWVRVMTQVSMESCPQWSHFVLWVKKMNPSKMKNWLKFVSFRFGTSIDRSAFGRTGPFSFGNLVLCKLDLVQHKG